MSSKFVFTNLHKHFSCFVSIDRVMKYLQFLSLLRVKYCIGYEVVYLDPKSIFIALAEVGGFSTGRRRMHFLTALMYSISKVD